MMKKAHELMPGNLLWYRNREWAKVVMLAEYRGIVAVSLEREHIYDKDFTARTLEMFCRDEEVEVR